MNYSPFETRLFVAATGSLVGESVDPARAGQFLGDVGTRAPWHVSWGLKLLLWLTWLAPLLLFYRVKSFLALDGGGQAEVWRRGLEHRRYLVRQLALVVKAMACLCHFDLDAPAGRPR